MIQYDELPGFLFDINPARVLQADAKIDSGYQVLTCVCAPVYRTCLCLLPTYTTIFSGIELPDFEAFPIKSACVLLSWST